MAELNFKALLVGNGSFPEDPHNLPELKGPRNDLRVMEGVLTHPQVGLFRKDAVTALLDQTTSEVMEAANDFFCSTGRNDQLLFYYSGHGLLDKYNNFYFSMRNTRINALIATAVSDAAINSMIRESSSSRVVIIIDCCHSGRFKSAAMSMHLQGEGRFVITSSRSNELAHDANEADQPSVFTRYLTEALMSGKVDRDGDGYISINELYDFILPKIYAETKQNPYRIFDKAVGQLALGRSNIGVPVPGLELAEHRVPLPRPILNVSITEIFLDDVQAGEELPEEIIDVFNEGGGTLEWTVECSSDWIQVEKYKRHIKLTFRPKPGTNRGRIYVRERTSGQTKRIQVRIKVLEHRARPQLVVSDTNIDFGKVSQHAERPTFTMRVYNEGEGDLAPRVSADQSWLTTRLRGEILEVSAETGQRGKFAGTVNIESLGGSVAVPVRLIVDSGPVLKIEPPVINFLTVSQGNRPESTLNIRNAGTGTLEWKFETADDFFSVKRRDDSLILKLKTRKLGNLQGSIFITSNGGEHTIPVRALVKEPNILQPVVPKTSFTDISGSWTGVGGLCQFIGTGPTYQYLCANSMGITVEQGSAHVVGNTVTLEAQSVVAGRFSGTLQVNGASMNGTLLTTGGRLPIALQRVRAGDPIMNHPMINPLAQLFS